MPDGLKDEKAQAIAGSNTLKKPKERETRFDGAAIGGTGVPARDPRLGQALPLNQARSEGSDM